MCTVSTFPEEPSNESTNTSAAECTTARGCPSRSFLWWAIPSLVALLVVMCTPLLLLARSAVRFACMLCRLHATRIPVAPITTTPTQIHALPFTQPLGQNQGLNQQVDELGCAESSGLVEHSQRGAPSVIHSSGLQLLENFSQICNLPTQHPVYRFALCSIWTLL